MYIGRALQSLLRQDFTAWELIAVDVGSVDKSFEILINFKKNYKNVIVIHQQHQNLAVGRNTGIKLSRGNFITFLDSDDEYLPSHLASRYNYMTNHPDIDLIHGGIIIEGNPFVVDKYNSNKIVHLSECVIGATFFGKRKVFENLDGFNDVYSEDSEFLERALKNFKVEKVDYPTYIYHRDTPDSITNKILLQ